jgi:membrane-associated phospholipid phosphatase
MPSLRAPGFRPSDRSPAASVAWSSVAGLVVLTVAVVTGAVDPADDALHDLARPGNVWGTVQARADRLVDGLGPDVAVWVPLVVAVVVCLARRSLRPAWMAAGTGLLASGAVFGLKVLIARPDPGGTTNHGGSFPSGHTMGVVVCSGLVVLLLWADPPRRAWWVPGLLAVAMGTALVLVGAHRASDVVGGALIGAAALAVASAAGAPRWAAAHGSTRSDREPGSARGGGRDGAGPPA